ncbi:MAG: winged helix DNA-binding domain-containing protein [Christensenellaceae bacterium]|jgi:hypothetical protein|nr:winged helix DNA-binding domain-containing protein [Christensenellaceae bacterium]
MAERDFSEEILRKRMHGLYLSRGCAGLSALSRELLGLHCWFTRNVPFSALIRGAEIGGWKTALTKTWLYRGTLHGVNYEDLPELLALHAGGASYLGRFFGEAFVERLGAEVLRYMEDGVRSRAEFRRIFAREYDEKTVEALFSPWGGIFVDLARRGQVAFRDMASRDFDLISAEPAQGFDEVLPGLLRRFFAAYGPATLEDAAWFFGLWSADAKKLRALPLDDLPSFEWNGSRYFEGEGEGEEAPMADIPELTLLSGFDPLLVSYADRSASLPPEHKARVILKSGICNPTVALRGRVAGLWNIKKGEPAVEFFEAQPERIRAAALERVDDIRLRTL